MKLPAKPHLSKHGIIESMLIKQPNSNALFIYLTMSAASSFETPLINAPILHAAKKGLNLLSLTLPSHGFEDDAKQGITRWAIAFDKGTDPLSEFIEQAADYINNLAEEYEYKSICVSGLSRGAFIASHLCARIHSTPTILLGFSPATSLCSLQAFKELNIENKVRCYDIKNLQKELASKPLKYYIGNYDRAVNTATCIQTIEAIRTYAIEYMEKHPQCELTLHPSLGHRGHGTAPEIFQSGTEWALNKL